MKETKEDLKKRNKELGMDIVNVNSVNRALEKRVISSGERSNAKSKIIERLTILVVALLVINLSSVIIFRGIYKSANNRPLVVNRDTSGVIWGEDITNFEATFTGNNLFISWERDGIEREFKLVNDLSLKHPSYKMILKEFGKEKRFFSEDGFWEEVDPEFIN